MAALHVEFSLGEFTVCEYVPTFDPRTRRPGVKIKIRSREQGLRVVCDRLYSFKQGALALVYVDSKAVALRVMGESVHGYRLQYPAHLGLGLCRSFSSAEMLIGYLEDVLVKLFVGYPLMVAATTQS